MKTTEQYIIRIASKLWNDGVDPMGFNDEQADGILSKTVSPIFCKKILSENRVAVIRTMKTFKVKTTLITTI